MNEVIKVAHRRWRKAWWSGQVRAERKALRERLRAKKYDIVLDMQALLKSAAGAPGARRAPWLDWRSAREPLASLFYNVRHKVEFWQPAVIRQRKLAALTSATNMPGSRTSACNPSRAQAAAPGWRYGPRCPERGAQRIRDAQAAPSGLDRGYAVVMPSASRDDKLWPEDDWRVVFRRLRDAGCTLKLLAGNEQEAERARLLVAGMDGAEVLPRMSLTDVARLLAGSRLMVGLDSGLTHLSAALGRPTIGIYRASTPVRTPLVGSNYTASLGDRGASPSREAVMASVEQALAAK